jgi:hypothetical protein
MRILGAIFAALALYYAWFFAQRGQPGTFVQLVTLICAVALLLVPASRRRWLVLAAAAVAVAVFVVIDRDSHSVGDTLNGIAPTVSLLLAIVLRLRYERTASSGNAPSVGTSS